MILKKITIIAGEDTAAVRLLDDAGKERQVNVDLARQPRYTQRLLRDVEGLLYFLAFGAIRKADAAKVAEAAAAAS